MEFFVLANGIKIPKVGMGTNTFGKEGNTYQGEINMDTKELIWAYQNGYRLVDTAIAYRNEAVIGKSIKESGLNRNEIFVTSKIPMRPETTATDELIIKAMDESIDRIGSYIDLYLIHHPGDHETNLKVWRQLEF
ncbi:MAG TPA: aldo/keto reductase, partial [Acholeplasma sp.]|nr:aldo/keto reductase [Acholeplasma sp.]